MRQAYCPVGKHFPESVVAYITTSADEDDDLRVTLGVLLDAEGSATNRYEDGTCGVLEIHAEEAEAEESVFCPVHQCECFWHHTADLRGASDGEE